MEKQHLRMLIVDAARAVLIARSNDPEVHPQIAALLNSLDDTLSDEQVLEQLRALRAGRSSFTIVDGPTARVRRPIFSVGAQFRFVSFALYPFCQMLPSGLEV